MKMGLSDLSDVKEKIVKIDKHKAIKYRIVEEIIYLNLLRQERDGLEAQLNMPEPSQEELTEWGKGLSVYHTKDKNDINKRIVAINSILGE